MNKQCKECGALKPIDNFYRNARMKEGRVNQCKECVIKQTASWARRNPDKVRQKYVATGNRHPERRAAVYALNLEKMTGRIKAWPVCAVPDCATEKPEAHHPDYSRPLDVVWLCRKHHHAAHAIARNSTFGA